MKIDGKVHCFFEQSGTFKNEFIKLGIPAEDYDIQNNFGQTDHVVDLFQAIEDAYDGRPSLFDDIRGGDLIMAFFPCIYFCQMSQYAQSLNYLNYRALTEAEAIDKIIARQQKRNEYLVLLTKLVGVCLRHELRLVFENPITGSFLNNYFLKPPTVKDNNRMNRGDYYVKPTGYWFWNCEPTYGESYIKDKEQKLIAQAESRWTQEAGICSEERSMISPDYARNFICDFILGIEQQHTLRTLF
ncbi:MAG: hypothetical protein IJF63_04835 [Alistipes sp.]|nr:hypothetical protein [Alistipes sp.]MBQ6862246.1 hypothetical protein [Alistipes sp.]